MCTRFPKVIKHRIYEVVSTCVYTGLHQGEKRKFDQINQLGECTAM